MVAADPASSPDGNGPVSFAWRTAGEPHRLARPSGLAVDEQGDLYVVDRSNRRVQKFDPDGKFLLHWDRLGAEEEPFLFRRDVEATVNRSRTQRAVQTRRTMTLRNRTRR